MKTLIDYGATFSECRRYRYTLWRTWDESLPTLAYVGLNPSTADEREDDPTIRRCRNFAMGHGFGGMVMLNLWAFRSTDPKFLPCVSTPEEDENLSAISRTAETVARVCAAWGAHPKSRARIAQVLPLCDEWWCLGTTKENCPRHPLYLKNTAQMTVWKKGAKR